MTTLTVANIAFTIQVPNVFPVPFPVQGFSQDDVVEFPEVKPTEVLIGVDNRKSSGYVAHLIPLRITLQADSPSILFFEQWWQTLDQVTDDLPGNASIISPALEKVWTFSNGTLTSYAPGPQGKKLFQPQRYEIMFASVTVAGV